MGDIRHMVPEGWYVKGNAGPDRTPRPCHSDEKSVGRNITSEVGLACPCYDNKPEGFRAWRKWSWSEANSEFACPLFLFGEY